MNTNPQGVCSVSGCGFPHVARGFCEAHYRRFKKTGNAESGEILRSGRSAEQKFNEKWMPVTDCGCWIWTGAVTEHGYGLLRIDGKAILAHRLSWALKHGSLNDSDCVLHKCDTPSCVRPDHLFLGSRADNVDDMISKGRGCFGEKRSVAVLTEDQVREIKNSTLSGYTLCKKYGVSNGCIQGIRSGRNWKHVAA